jgi:hypothetical protein
MTVKIELRLLINRNDTVKEEEENPKCTNRDYMAVISNFA